MLQLYYLNKEVNSTYGEYGHVNIMLSNGNNWRCFGKSFLCVYMAYVYGFPILRNYDLPKETYTKLKLNDVLNSIKSYHTNEYSPHYICKQEEILNGEVKTLIVDDIVYDDKLYQKLYDCGVKNIIGFASLNIKRN